MSVGGGKGDVDAGPALDYSKKALALQKSNYDQSRADIAPWYQAGGSAVTTLQKLLGLKQNPGSLTSNITRDSVKQGLYDSGQLKAGDTSQTATNAINAAWAKAKADDVARLQSEYSAAESDPYFGSLAKNFSMEDYQADPGYQFRLGEGTKALERKLNAAGKTYSPEAAKALASYGQGLASEEYGNAYNRYTNDQNNLFNRLATLSGFGQNASNQMGAYGQNYANAGSDLYTGMGNAITAANVANASNKGSMFNTLVGAGAQLGGAYLLGPYGGAAAGAAGLVSDRRLKTDIQEHGEKNGHKLYKFRYINDPETQYIGVMADEVEHVPGAVFEVEGYKRVDYSKLGLDMEVVNAH